MSLWAWIVGVVADDGDADVAAASVTLTVEAPVMVSSWSACRVLQSGEQPRWPSDLVTHRTHLTRTDDWTVLLLVGLLATSRAGGVVAVVKMYWTGDMSDFPCTLSSQRFCD